MKKILNLFKLFILFLIIAFIYFAYDMLISQKELKNKNIIVEKGENVRQIYSKIGLKYSITDRIFFKLTNVSKDIKKGYYEFDGKLTKYEIINLLTSPKLNEIALTIPEGFTSEQVLDRIEALGLAKKQDMLNEMKKYDFYYKHSENFEGYLYPETYYFSKGVSPKEILDKILNQFLQEFPPVKYGKNEIYDKIIMASIIEKEAKKDEDREYVSSVFYNRLKIDMPLQSDATLKYELKRNVYKNDLKLSDSKYNTYKFKGLTPTPICNPGKKSIEAAFNPAETKYLYFFMYEGKTYYSYTHNEHLQKRRESGHLK